MPPRFLDTNILLRYLTRDDERKAQAALALLRRIEWGEERVVTTQAVIFETVFTLQRFYKVPRPAIVALVLPIVMLRGFQVPNKPLYRETFDLYMAWNAVLIRSQGLTEIYSWDTDFDELSWLTRIEPEEERQWMSGRPARIAPAGGGRQPRAARGRGGARERTARGRAPTATLTLPCTTMACSGPSPGRVLP